MLIFFNFTKHRLPLPIVVSEAEYNEMKSAPDYLKVVTNPEWQIFHENYKVPILMWFSLTILTWIGYSLYEQQIPEWGTILIGIVGILAMVKSLSYGLSAYSLWEVIQLKKKLYARIKVYADNAHSYSEFAEKYMK